MSASTSSRAAYALRARPAQPRRGRVAQVSTQRAAPLPDLCGDPHAVAAGRGGAANGPEAEAGSRAADTPPGQSVVSGWAVAGPRLGIPGGQGRPAAPLPLATDFNHEGLAGARPETPNRGERPGEAPAAPAVQQSSD